MSRRVVLTGEDFTLEEVYAAVFEISGSRWQNEARRAIEASGAVIERCPGLSLERMLVPSPLAK
jgi:hypothetical protein